LELGVSAGFVVARIIRRGAGLDDQGTGFVVTHDSEMCICEHSLENVARTELTADSGCAHTAHNIRKKHNLQSALLRSAFQSVHRLTRRNIERPHAIAARFRRNAHDVCDEKEREITPKGAYAPAAKAKAARPGHAESDS
jgi:hypothetical protein